MSSHDYLTGVLREIADLFPENPGEGLRAALAIAEAKGGTEAHFPARAPDDHWLPRAVGREAADRICAHFAVGRGGVRLEVPLGPHRFYARARRMAAELVGKGRSTNEVARAVGVHGRTVWRIKARMRDTGDDDQGSLF